jgi:glyoxylase-like metal-dependent hydrolase (beta-lactamase superfamily II)
MSEHRGALTAEGERYPSPRHAIEYLDVGPPEPGHAVAIGGGLAWARIPLPMELNHINVWLLADGDGWTLVDTGLADDVCRAAWHTLEAGGLDGRPLVRIVVTHDHPDHMGLSRWLHERHRAPLWMSEVGHRSTGEFLAAGAVAQRVAQHAFATAHGMEVDLDALHKAAAGSEHGRWYGGLAPLGRAVAGGDALATTGRDWQVVETSGHCRGHLCLYDEAGGVLISGDQVLPTISPNVSVLPSRPEADPLRDFLDSLARLERCAPGTLVLPSHGRPFHGLHRRIESLRSHHLQQLDGLRAACREPRSAHDLLPVMYGRPLRGFHRFLALGETVAHLNYLWHGGELARKVGDDGRIRFVAS